ncbi:unnamed protein product [Candida verbasci]|uniref:RRM domain-containing protein n=1 Tax=Candida verbasci TaxID=1227364 RepID=A0A9W4TVY5_9ASCO|nr:unnamed protein product [Candida verbasci]
MSGNQSKYNRVYIKNLSYYAQESDLEELFKNHEPYTVRLTRSGRHKPLGIAYADFKTSEQVESVIQEFDGFNFKSRKLSVKKHQAYNPNRGRFFGLLGGKNDQKKETESEEEDETQDLAAVEPEQPRQERVPETKKDLRTKAKELFPHIPEEPEEVSEDTLFIAKAHGKVTDATIREFLKEYNPSEIYIFKNKSIPKLGPINLSSSYVSVLAKVDASDVQLNDIIENLKTQKLNGKNVELRPASKSSLDIEKAKSKPSIEIEREGVKSRGKSRESSRGVETSIDTNQAVSDQVEN